MDEVSSVVTPNNFRINHVCKTKLIKHKPKKNPSKLSRDFFNTDVEYYSAVGSSVGVA
jgi:hypothetical protein